MAVALLTLSACSMTLSPAADLPRYEPLDECFVELPTDFEIDVDIDCGYVLVPEFYTDESSREVKVGVTRLNARQDTSKAPLLMLAGGPGQTEVQPALFELFQPALLGNILDERDIVLVEQRGTKYTDTFLDCPTYFSLPWQIYEQGLDTDAAAALEWDIVQSCSDAFRAQGIDYDAYNSLTLAADVDAVRTALGYERIIYYGASYGAQLGQHIMRDFPDMLEAVILDGANSLSRLHWTEDRALSRQWGIDNLTALCQADAQCAAAYDIPALLDAALDLFADGPLPATYVDPDDDTISYAVELSQKDLVDFIAQEQESRIAVLAIPYILSQFSQGDQEDALALLAEEKVSKILDSREATQGAEALLMHLAVVCSDDAVTSPDQVETAGVSRFAESFGKDEASWYATACGLIDVTELPPSTDVDVTLAVPTLLLSGGLDVATPTFRTQVVADALPDAQLVIFPSRTHVQIAGANFCAGQITTQFVLDPTGPLDTSCIEDDRVLGFVLPDGSMSGEQE